MKIIFLDFDGVLNNESFFIKRHRNMQGLRMIDLNKINETDLKVKYLLCEIDLDNLDILKEIINDTDSKVVVISSWKKLKVFYKVSKHLVNLGIPIIGMTSDNSDNRGEGIKNYLKNHEVDNYIVIDDDIFPDYDEEIMNHLVKTSFYNCGLTEENKEEAINKLNGKSLKLN